MELSAASHAPRIPLAQLGWRALKGPEPTFNEGPVSLLVIAPWCPDCQEIAAALPKDPAPDRATWLIGEFAPAEDVLLYSDRAGLQWPILHGTVTKDELARNEARFRHLREAAGDKRRWGVPLWIEGRIENGWLIAAELRWP
jgi:hypothetical protein